jgi:hypothetical protein
MTLVAPGSAVMAPTVPTRPAPSVLQNSSTATMHSAAPASASRRSAIGTVPAWPAMPERFAASRVAPDIAVTTPTGRFCCFQHRPLLDMQFDIGMQLAAGTGRRADMLRFEPKLHHRLAHGEAVRVARVEHALIKVPATARLPSKVEAKRTPSSSAKPTTSIANGNRTLRRFRSATQAIAVITPSGPSHLPASRTVS